MKILSWETKNRLFFWTLVIGSFFDLISYSFFSTEHNCVEGLSGICRTSGWPFSFTNLFHTLGDLLPLVYNFSFWILIVWIILSLVRRARMNRDSKTMRGYLRVLMVAVVLLGVLFFLSKKIPESISDKSESLFSCDLGVPTPDEASKAAGVRDRHNGLIRGLPQYTGSGIGCSENYPGKAVIHIYFRSRLTPDERRQVFGFLDGVPVELIEDAGVGHFR